jgi:hypothetical protein
MPTRPSNAAILDECSKRIAGVLKYVDPAADIPVAGKLVKPAHVLAVFQAHVDQRNLVTTLQAQVKSALAERDAKEAECEACDKALRAYVSNRFGEDSTEAHGFGYPPRKPPTKSAETKALAAERARATRAARHTMGAKQKAELRGTTEVALTPEQAEAIAAGDATASVKLVPKLP